MKLRNRAHHRPKPRVGLGLLAVLLVPLLLALHAPVLAAVVPGALLTVASLEAIEDRGRDLSLPTVEIVNPGDPVERARMESAVEIPGASRRVSTS